MMGFLNEKPIQACKSLSDCDKTHVLDAVAAFGVIIVINAYSVVLHYFYVYV